MQEGGGNPERRMAPSARSGERDLRLVWLRDLDNYKYIYIYIYILLYVYFVFIKKGSYQILYTVLQSRYIHSTGTHALWLFMGKN